MKKILALTLAVAMLASMSVGATAAAMEADATGGIRIALFPPGQYPPPIGPHCPDYPGENPFDPPIVWPPFPGTGIRLPVEMDSLRAMPISTPHIVCPAATLWTLQMLAA